MAESLGEMAAFFRSDSAAEAWQWEDDRFSAAKTVDCVVAVAAQAFRSDGSAAGSASVELVSQEEVWL